MHKKTAIKIAKALDSKTVSKDTRAILDACKKREDFIVELSMGEYRIIHDNAIEDIFDGEIRELADDCYNIKRIKEELGNVGRYLTFDYDSFIADCRMDGYGHHFSGYDGSEESVGPWYIFRVN